MQKLHYEKQTVTIADNWNELTGKQLIELVDIIHHEKTRLQSQIMALKVLTRRCKISFFMLRPDVKDAFLPYAGWVFEENTLTTQLLPNYDELYGPGDELNDLRMKEFHFTELYYKNYMEEKQQEDLNMLIATMYRPVKVVPGWADMPVIERIAFDANLTATYAKRVSEWPLAMRLAILFYYDGCRQNIIDLYDRVFTGGTDSTSDEKAAYGMYGLMMELAGEKLGTIHQVEDMLVHSAMASLELLIINAEQLEAQMQKQ